MKKLLCFSLLILLFACENSKLKEEIERDRYQKFEQKDSKGRMIRIVEKGIQEIDASCGGFSAYYITAEEFDTLGRHTAIYGVSVYGNIYKIVFQYNPQSQLLESQKGYFFGRINNDSIGFAIDMIEEFNRKENPQNLCEEKTYKYNKTKHITYISYTTRYKDEMSLGLSDSSYWSECPKHYAVIQENLEGSLTNEFKVIEIKTYNYTHQNLLQTKTRYEVDTLDNSKFLLSEYIVCQRDTANQEKNIEFYNKSEFLDTLYSPSFEFTVEGKKLSQLSWKKHEIKDVPIVVDKAGKTLKAKKLITLIEFD